MRRLMRVFGVIIVTLALEVIVHAQVLPKETSRYNRGGSGFPGRYRDERGRVKRFPLTDGKTRLYDGSGRVIGIVRQAVMLNVGAAKEIVPAGEHRKKTFLWAWATDAGLSGWVARDALVNPPNVDADARVADQRNPKPPLEAKVPLSINASDGTRKLKGLVHVNSQGILPRKGGNRGVHYGGRNPGPRDYVYLLFAVPNVQRGGPSKDSIPDGGEFIQGLDEKGQPIIEIVTMYRDFDFDKPAEVTFLYGREESSDRYGWIARANVGEL